MPTVRSLLTVAAATVVAWACSSEQNLPTATIENFVDSVALSSITGTAITEPSAFSIPDRQAIRTDRSSNFDFAFELVGDTARLLPLRYLGVAATSGVNPGVQFTTTPFDDIQVAVKNNYITQEAVVVKPGDVLYARSRLVCTSLSVPQYGKLEILTVDPVTRVIRFKYLVNNNCGYTSLQPGLPRE
jgi:hypothetical protein